MVGKNQVYALRFGNLQLCLLDSNRELPYLLQQNNWLEQQVKGDGARWNVVVLHHPIYSAKSGSNNLMQRWLSPRRSTTMPTLCSKGTNMPMPA